MAPGIGLPPSQGSRVARRTSERIVVALGDACGTTLRFAFAGLIACLLVALLAFLHLLHLLGHALHAAAETFERAPLRIDGLAILPLAEGAFGLPHGLLGVAEALLVLHALTLHPALEFAQPLPQGLLTLAQALSERILLRTGPPCSPFSACSWSSPCSPFWPCWPL